MSRIWNSDFMRMMVPDMIRVNVSGSIVSGGGGAITHEAHLVTRGPDAGLYSTISKIREGWFAFRSFRRGFSSHI